MEAAAAAGSSISAHQEPRGMRDIQPELCEELALLGTGSSYLHQGLLTL